MTLYTNIDSLFNNFFISSTIGFVSGGITYIGLIDITSKYKYTKINWYNLFNYGGFCGFILGVTRWYTQKPVLEYFLK
jgi:hypothetical protein